MCTSKYGYLCWAGRPKECVPLGVGVRGVMGRDGAQIAVPGWSALIQHHRPVKATESSKILPLHKK